jgi:hypothetical protein
VSQATPPLLRAYIDETGDRGHTARSSPFFAFAAVLVADEDEAALRAAMSHLHRDLKVPPGEGAPLERAREDLSPQAACREHASSETAPGIFPGTLQGLLEALAAARYRSAAGTPKVLVIADGKKRQVIRRFEGGKETWSASTAEISRERRP